MQRRSLGHRRALATLVILSLLAACQATPSRTDDPGAKKPDTLIVAVTADGAAAGFNPRTSTSFPSRRLFGELYSSLVEKNYFDPSKPFGIVPGLATSWEISPDGKKYTFKLRTGVQFTDGTPFDADAVAFNYQVLLDKSSPYYDAASTSGTAKYTSLVDSYRALDKNTFELTLKSPVGWYFDEIATPNPMGIISPAAIKQYGMKGIGEHPVGTGPFKLETYKKGESIVLSRNDTYFRGPAAVKTLVFQVMTDPAARAVALESGQVQIAEDISPQYKSQWASRSDIETRVTSNPATYICRLDYRNGPTTKLDFRRALSLAVNRDQLNQLVSNGLAVIPNSVYSPGAPSYAAEDPKMTFDPKAAAATINELGLKGTKLVYEVTPTLGNPQMWDVLNKNLSDIGLSPVQQTVDLATYLADLRRGLSEGKDGSKLTNPLNMMCSASGTDSEWTLATTAQRQSAPDQAVACCNAGYYGSPKVEAAFAQAQNALTPDAYFAAMRQANKEIVADYGVIYLLSNVNVHGVKKTVEWQPTPSQAHTYYHARFK
jgi:peptide/nickel transport system substrate-binding protein